MSDLKQRIPVNQAWEKARTFLVTDSSYLESHLERRLRRTPVFFETAGWVFAPKFGSQVFVSYDGAEVKSTYNRDYSDTADRGPSTPIKGYVQDVVTAKKQLYGPNGEALIDRRVSWEEVCEGARLNEAGMLSYSAPHKRRG